MTARTGKHGRARRGPTYIAQALSAIAGCGDAAGYLLLGHVYTSHISGDSIDVGVHLATRSTVSALRHFGAIATFFTGVIIGLILIEVLMQYSKRRMFGIVLAIEAVLILAFFAVAARPSPWMLVFPALAFGVQNALLRRAGHYKVRTTYVSGMLTNSAHSFVQAGMAYFKRSRSFPRKRGDALFYGSIWLCFMLGGIVGAQLQVHFARYALLAPTAALLALALIDQFFPALD